MSSILPSIREAATRIKMLGYVVYSETIVLTAAKGREKKLAIPKI